MSNWQPDYLTANDGSRLARIHNANDKFGWDGYTPDLDTQLINSFKLQNASEQFIDAYISELHSLRNLKYSLRN